MSSSKKPPSRKAYQSGFSAALKLSQSLSFPELEDLIRNFDSNPAQDFDLIAPQGDKARKELARLLGITPRDILHLDPSYGKALAEYDRGYLKALQNIHTAALGN